MNDNIIYDAISDVIMECEEDATDANIAKIVYRKNWDYSLDDIEIMVHEYRNND